MDRGFHRRFLNKRQGLGGALGNLIPGVSTPSSVTQDTKTSAASQNTGNALDPGGIISTPVGNVPTPILGLSSTATSSTPLTLSPSSSTGSTASSVKTATSTSVMTPASTPTTSTTPTPTPTPSVPDIVYTTTDGTSTFVITSTLPAASASATAAPPTSFLQNPSLEGGVFALVGIVVLIIIFIVVTWTIRKRRRDRLERDLAVAVTFDPGVAADHLEYQEDSIMKHRLSGSSSGHSHSHGYGYGYGMQPAYAPQQEYHGPAGYGQYPPAAYCAPSPNPAPYQAPSPTVSQPSVQGGANLTRKFSDRKPVPPLLPDHAYDPANAHVSIPPQFYQQ